MTAELTPLLGVSNRPTATDSENLAAIPFWMPVLAALPVSLCMAIMGLPQAGERYAMSFRILYGLAYLVWVCPIAALQRWLWRRHRHWVVTATALLGASYVMSVINCALGLQLARHYGSLKTIQWHMLFSDLDGCWLALIAFCALHAVVAYYAALGRERNRLIQARAEARDAQLQALRYQLHPHFLFNTLNAISALVATRRDDEAQHMIAQLAEFLRATLDCADTHEHSLAEELALTDCYLAIEKARLGSRLHIDMHIGPDALDAMVPYLLLQPLAENAIRHGIARRSLPGRMRIDVQRNGERLHIQLCNDGAGEPTPSHLDGQASGIGLRNVGSRLATLYPDDHTIRAGSVDDNQYEVRINLPLRTAKAARLTWEART